MARPQSPLTRSGAQGVARRERVRRQVVASNRLFGVPAVLLQLLQLPDERIVALRLAVAAVALIVWLALAEWRVVVRNAEAKSSGQTLLLTETET